MVFSPGTFAGAPVADIATVTYPGGGSDEEETALMKAVTDTFPRVTALRVKEALDAVGAIVTNLVLRGAGGERDYAGRGRPGAGRRTRCRTSAPRL
jgi:hypothetical protein